MVAILVAPPLNGHSTSRLFGDADARGWTNRMISGLKRVNMAVLDFRTAVIV